MKHKLLAAAALSMLIAATQVQAWDPHIDTDHPEETLIEFNKRLADNSQVYSRTELYNMAQYGAQAEMVKELRKIRCLLEKIEGQTLSPECLNPQPEPKNN